MITHAPGDLDDRLRSVALHPLPDLRGRLAGCRIVMRFGDRGRDLRPVESDPGKLDGGERRFVPVLSRAATAVGVAGLFIETHQDPDDAPSDGPNMVPLKELEPLLRELMEIDRLVKR